MLRFKLEGGGTSREAISGCGAGRVVRDDLWHGHVHSHLRLWCKWGLRLRLEGDETSRKAVSGCEAGSVVSKRLWHAHLMLLL